MCKTRIYKNTILENIALSACVCSYGNFKEAQLIKKHDSIWRSFIHGTTN